MPTNIRLRCIHNRLRRTPARTIVLRTRSLTRHSCWGTSGRGERVLDMYYYYYYYYYCCCCYYYYCCYYYCYYYY